MKCEICEKEIIGGPIVRKSMWNERYFCSGQCAKIFDEIFFSIETAKIRRESRTPFAGL